VVERVSHRIGVMQARRIVETGPTDVLLTDPQQAHTRTLLASIPRPGSAARRRPKDAAPPGVPPVAPTRTLSPSG